MLIEQSKPKYVLSQVLPGHSAAVRSLSYGDGILISGSSDKIAKVFTFDGAKYEQSNQLDFYSNYIYAVSIRIGGGFAVASGNQVYLHDVEVCQLSLNHILIQGNPIGCLEGHTGQVCSLSSTHANFLVSGSWDQSAIVWDLSTQTALYKLDGHKYGVCVHHSQQDPLEVVTGSQDGVLRRWLGEKQIQKVEAHSDIIREIISVPVGYMTCSNDETIKMWSGQLELLAQFLGHTGFVFSVKTHNILGQQYYYSASDDNSVRVWVGMGELVQSINHPATVWTVSINTSNSDILTGSADGMIRVFTAEPKRNASSDELEAYEREVELAVAKGPSGISEEQLSKMPSVEQLSSFKGKKVGEVRIFRNGTKPEVYAWGEDKWDKIGDVVGGSTKKVYPGDQYFPSGEYDYIFDVDDDNGGHKRIPVNDGDNHLDVAERFCRREGYSKNYLTQVMIFLQKNTKAQQPKQLSQQIVKFECIPYTQFFFFESMNVVGLQKKVIEFNTLLRAEGNPLALTELELHQFNQSLEILKNMSTDLNMDSSIILIMNKLLRWPSQYILPVYDYLRIFELHHSSEKLYAGLDSGLTIISEIPVHIQYNSTSLPFLRLSLQILCNLFKQNTNTYAALRHLDVVQSLIHSVMDNKDTKVAEILSNLLLNYSIAIYQKPNQEAARVIGNLVATFLRSGQRADDCVAKVVTAIGNLTQSADANVKIQAKQAISSLLDSITLEDAGSQKCVDEVRMSLQRI